MRRTVQDPRPCLTQYGPEHAHAPIFHISSSGRGSGRTPPFGSRASTNKRQLRNFSSSSFFPHPHLGACASSHKEMVVVVI